MGPFVDVIKGRAEKPPAMLDCSVLSHEQTLQKIGNIEKSLKKERLARLDATKAISRLRVHQQTCRVLFDLVGTRDVPGLHRIFKNAKHRSWSMEKLLKMTQMASEGTYRAKNFSDLEFDLATTIYELGGGAALYALQKSPFAFPSRTTILERRQDFKLRITAGQVKMSDILANIETMFKDVSPGHHKVPITLSMDEVASDGRPCYLPETDDITGLCEHAAAGVPSVKMGKDLNVVRAVAQAVRDGKIHVGKEVFVAAFARNDETDYGAKPVLLMPTCKKGSYRDAALVIEMLRQAWKISPYGESLHGSLMSIASDGDPKRCPALYLHCMVRELTPADPVFKHLGNLPGLNLWTGSGGKTQDLDYKHDMKRLCKLFCTREGLLIDSVVLNKGVLAAWLERLTDVDWSENTIFSLLNTESSTLERIHTLLSPKDAQDVPRAIKLLNLTADLRNLDPSGFDPSEQKTHCAISLLGELLEALVEPFINPDLSISQQVTSLIKFAHILCALFLKHESAFMPHHLYNNLQCMVRTAVFRPIFQNTSDGKSIGWFWDSRFVALDSAKATRTQQATIDRLRHLTFTFNGRLVIPLNSSQVRSISISTLPPNSLKGNRSGNTWVIAETVLQDIKKTLLERLQANEGTHSKIPVFGRVRQGEFPYKAVIDSAESLTNIEHTITSITPPSAASAPQACNICCQQVSGPDRQNHMGRHILRKLRGIAELSDNIDMGSIVSMEHPCGFCGQSSIGGACEVRIQSGKALSKCSHAYEFRIGPASKISKQKACTNVPVQCRLCTEVHWKYNMHQHLQARHPSWEENVLDGRELQEFRDKIKITYEEETRLGIPDDRRGLHVVSSDVRHANPLYLPSIRDERGDSPRRPRRDTLNPVSFHPLPVQPIQLPTPSNLRPSSALRNTSTDVFL
ncbi:hypothetical protein B0H34DRAFT_811419 [Crassisporium funariophilum]|nr:hypothetical protein B0H34DRAFT_811419 [Crassisporium funariophilum]